MGLAPPPIYNGSAESKEAFAKWVLCQERMSTFRTACLGLGAIAVIWLLCR